MKKKKTQSNLGKVLFLFSALEPKNGSFKPRGLQIIRVRIASMRLNWMNRIDRKWGSFVSVDPCTMLKDKRKWCLKNGVIHGKEKWNKKSFTQSLSLTEKKTRWKIALCNQNVYRIIYQRNSFLAIVTPSTNPRKNLSRFHSITTKFW